MKTYEKIKQIVADMDQDVQKFANGNKSAGTRVRKHCQELKKAAQECRLEVQSAREKE